MGKNATGHNHEPAEAHAAITEAMVQMTFIGSTLGNLIKNTYFGDDANPAIKEAYHEYTLAFVKMSAELMRPYDPFGASLQDAMHQQMVAQGYPS